jgi:hypothetical protein
MADKLSHGVQDFVANKPRHHISLPIRGILIVGAAGMAGSHLLRHPLNTTTAPIYYITIPMEDNEASSV